MLDYERKLQIWDITITIVLFIIGCVAGKLMTIYASDTWFSFNGRLAFLSLESSSGGVSGND